MAQNVSDFIWQRLSEWGFKRVYGYPGDGVGSLDVALEKAKDIMEYVQVRHEEMAAFMASAHAKFTGQVGLCYATSGPGAIHLLNGLYDAKLDHMPVVALVANRLAQRLARAISRKWTCKTCSKTSQVNLSAWRASPSRFAISSIARSGLHTPNGQ